MILVRVSYLVDSLALVAALALPVFALDPWIVDPCWSINLAFADPNWPVYLLHRARHSDVC